MKDSNFLKFIKVRADAFQPNVKLDNLIFELKSMLEPIQKKNNTLFSGPTYPVVMVVGCSRAGTTLLTQLLASSGDFAYPTNFLSRFAYAPQIGAMIQQMLFNPDYNFRDEFVDIRSSSDFYSDLGKTKGAMGISEFFHFWRKFFPVYEPTHLSKEELSQVDISLMRSELAAIQSVFDKPFLSKGKMFQYNIDYFDENIPELFFIHIRRDHYFVMQSTMLSRRKYYNNDEIWWAGKPKEYEWLKDMDPFYQIAGQVIYTEKAIDEQLARVNDKRKLICNYEELCDDPNNIYEQLRIKLANNNCQLHEYNIKKPLISGNVIKMDQDELSRLESAYNDLMSGKYYQYE